jgi:Flp pilus assembly protein TadG
MYLHALLKRFRHSQVGSAAVEFALILPIMLLVYIGTVEASTLISMDRRVQAVTGTVGDLVARSSTTITGAQLRDYFRAATGVMTPYPATNIRQVVTQVRVNADRSTQVVWTRQFNNNTYSSTTPYRVGDPFTLPTALIDISLNGFVIVSETRYANYKPLYGIFFNQAITLNRQNFYLPRFGGSISIAD